MRAARSGFVLLFLAVGCTKFVPSVPVIELVSIPAGSFVMGSLQGEKGRLDDEAVCTVTLARPFLLGKMEVTQGQWRKVMGTEPWKWQAFVQAGNDYAVTCVSWNDATAFCEKLTDLESKTGKLKAGEEYRLPTEAEWEYACRAGTTTAFSFGEDESKLSDFAWFDGNTKNERYAHQVGRKMPNPGGLHDMHGNAWEWCSDWYGEKLPGGTDPVGPGGGSHRVVRGGHWGYTSAYCRSATRLILVPSSRYLDLGFRVVRSQAVQ